jgi:5-methylthioribose kinase
MFLNAANLPAITGYLKGQSWINQDETVISATKPGEGNMNYVLRINTGSRTFIIKQSRPYAEKYPSVAAPAKRVLSEAAFYNLTQKNNFLKPHTPYLIGIDTVNNVLAMQDFGTAADYTFLYQPTNKLIDEDARALINFLNHLHTDIEKNNDPLLINTTMKELNHQHIFIFPFMEENGFNLDNITDGLQLAAMEYKTNKPLKEKIEVLGDIYLANGKYLLHGDFYPGSWLKTADGIKIIDPEFCFFGKAEYDLGVLLAHCYLSQQTQSTLQIIEGLYKKNAGFDEKLLQQFTGIEIMRRLIGLAQLPLSLSLQIKKDLLEEAFSFIMEAE